MKNMKNFYKLACKVNEIVDVHKGEYGIKYNPLGIVTDDIHRDDISGQPEFLSKVYEALSTPQQKILENLLNIFVNTITASKNDEIKFKFERAKKLNRIFEEYKVYFTDNLAGNTLLFLPTYLYAVKQVGKKHEITGYDEIPKNLNRIVDNWEGEDWSDPDPDSFGTGSKTSAWINLYKPESYVEDKCISMIIESDGGLKSINEGIEKFKIDFNNMFVINPESPIANRITNLLYKGYSLISKKKENKENIKTRKKLEKLKGKIF